jgi:hypothetical protein
LIQQFSGPRRFHMTAAELAGMSLE